MLGEMTDPLVFFVISAKGLPGIACTTVKMLNEFISCTIFPS